MSWGAWSAQKSSAEMTPANGNGAELAAPRGYQTSGMKPDLQAAARSDSVYHT